MPGEFTVLDAVSFVAETNLVEMAAPDIHTAAPCRKPVPLTVIVNAPTGTVEGEMEVTTGPTVLMVTVDDPDTFVLTVLVAVIFTYGGDGTANGAVYNPLLLIVPPPPIAPFTDQVTVFPVSPVTVAVYCLVPFTATDSWAGVTAIDCARKTGRNTVTANSTLYKVLIMGKPLK